MQIATLAVKLHAPWVHSLKEKRMEVKSLLAKLRNKFNVSAAEVDEQDTHQIIVGQRILVLLKIQLLHTPYILRFACPYIKIKIPITAKLKEFFCNVWMK